MAVDEHWGLENERRLEAIGEVPVEDLTHKGQAGGPTPSREPRA